ncbi:hypothetical protein SGLAM104S_06419 [Streptomyces glaucescens]
MLIIVGSLTYFETVLILTKGGPGTDTAILPYLMYEAGFKSYDFGYASAIASFLVVTATGSPCCWSGYRLRHHAQHARRDVTKCHDTLPRPAKLREPSPPSGWTSRARRPWTRRANPVAGLGSLIWLVVLLVPIYAMLSASLTRQDQLAQGNPLKPPPDPTLDNYNTVLDSGFGHLLANTAIVAAAVVGLVLALSVPLAYVAVRTRNRWSGAAFPAFLLGVAIPAQAVVVPLYLLIAELGLYDTLPAVILPTAAFAMPVSVLVLTGTLRDISEELYEDDGPGTAPPRCGCCSSW